MKIPRIIPPLPVIAAVAFVLAAYLVWSTQPRELRADAAFSPPEATFERSVAAVGLVEPKSELIALSTAVPGLVVSVAVSVGDVVHAGQALFQLDDRDLRALLAVREQELATARTSLERLRRQPRAEDLPPLEARLREAQQALADARVQQDMIEGVDDPRAIRKEDLLRRRIATRAAEAGVATAQAELARVRAGAWSADIEVAQANVRLAEKQVEQVRTDIERLTVTAPRDGRILKLNVRAGEYAQSGVLADPLVVFGDVTELHVRADVDEQEARWVRPEAHAYASPRGDASIRIPLTFVRFEPYVVPKRQLTGAVIERVDTRVLQVIYRLDGPLVPLFVGQQVDVYIDRSEPRNESTPAAAGTRPVADRGETRTSADSVAARWSRTPAGRPGALL